MPKGTPNPVSKYSSKVLKAFEVLTVAGVTSEEAFHFLSGNEKDQENEEKVCN